MSTENTGRRQKVVMALGIATIILFSANLLTVLAKHFWPDNGLPFLSAQEEVIAEDAHHYEFHVRAERPDRKQKQRIVVRTPHAVSEIHFDELDRDIAEMEQAARRLEREINREMSRLNSENILVQKAKVLEIAALASGEADNAQTIRIFKSGEGEGLVEVHVDGEGESERIIELQNSLEEDIRIELEQAMQKLESELEDISERKHRFRVRASDS